MAVQFCWQVPGLFLLLSVCLYVFPVSVLSGRVLVMPVDGSHWLSLKLLVTELAERGHNVLLLVPNTSVLIEAPEPVRMQTFPVPFDQEELASSMKGIQQGVFHQSPPLTDLLINVQRLLLFTDIQVRGCEALLYNKTLMEKLKHEDFNLLLTDPFLPCGAILSSVLHLPSVFFLRGMPCGLDALASQCPAPPSYVPRFGVTSTGHMAFPQRLQNVLLYLVELLLCRVMYRSFDELVARYLEEDISYLQLLGNGALWLLRYDFTFEFPKPIMPNMVFIGGINCKKCSPLTAEVEEFVEGSGEHGLVVFTLGSLVSSMPKEKAAIFFQAFSQIPQRVVWRYTGELPDHVPDNVKLMKWLPQNDLLGHPKTRAFITHGGTHGIYEGICHAVPMVILPLFGDQGDNAHRMANRGVGLVLDIHEITPESLSNTLHTIINDTSYKEKMVKLSSIHKDRPTEPLDLAVFWTEFVMRHKGADHLRPAAHDLNWFQYHSLDVIGFLLLVIMIVVAALMKCCVLCLRRYCKSEKKKKD
ncbi:UDP-glucuronosyltransferase-like isoform X3 [Hoplias malabaricus]|uniref:UDP-glucuronosyltransferase-like isoform X3 n=1 Tax=Hoplias malabaricus TaxID=27720 RepID=UPI0034626235